MPDPLGENTWPLKKRYPSLGMAVKKMHRLSENTDYPFIRLWGCCQALEGWPQWDIQSLGGLPISWEVAVGRCLALEEILGPLGWLWVGSLPSTGEREHVEECLNQGGWLGRVGPEERLWAQHPVLRTRLGAMPFLGASPGGCLPFVG